MKTCKFALLALVAASLFFYTCTKDEGDETPVITGDINAFLNANKPQSQFFTINAAQLATVIEGEQGTRLIIRSNSFINAAGDTVKSGSIEIELKEVYSVKDMIFSRISTTAGDTVLTSGGQVYLAARQNSELLRRNKDKLLQMTMPTSFTSQPMQKYYGDVNSDSIITWTLADTTTIVPSADSAGLNFRYYFNIDSLRWINCDYPTGGVRMTISGVASESFTDQNTAVALVFSSINSATPFRYNTATSTFSETLIFPTTIPAVLVAIAEKDSQLYYYQNSITLSDGYVETINLSPVTEAALQAALDSL